MLEMNIGVLLILGISIFGGIISALLIKRLHIPQVLGYIIMGIIIGETGFGIVSKESIELLKPLNFFALGIIGFLVGSEIRFETLKKYGRQFSSIMISEGLLAFILVSAPVTVILFILTHNFISAFAAGIVFGAIASATDPASTIDVLWEYRTAGILTTTLVAVIALDDALAMTLYGLGTGVAQVLSGGAVSIVTNIVKVFCELLCSLGLGVITGLLLNFILRRSPRREYSLSLAIGVLLLCIGTAVMYGMDVILAGMAGGVTVINSAPKRSREIVNLIQSFSTPIYILFFVMVGARLSITTMPLWLWLIIIVYVVGRSIGKFTGAYIGASVSGAEPVVKQYAGFGLFAQGGVAVGLSIMASQHLNTIVISDSLTLGDTIIFGITTTTLIVQVIGPPLVKFSVKKAGEVGKNITEEDIIAEWKVEDVLDRDVPVANEKTVLREIFEFFSTQKRSFCVITGKDNRALGIVTFDEIKELVLDRSNWDWIVASDIMTNIKEWIFQTVPLKTAIVTMQQTGIEQAPVFDNSNGNRPVGVLDLGEIKRRIHSHLLALKPA